MKLARPHFRAKKIGKQQLIERAGAGDPGRAAAYCDTLMISTGRTTIGRDELEVFEKAAGSGFLAAVRGLLTNHKITGSTRPAQSFAN